MTTKKELLALCNVLGLKNIKNKTKDELSALIKSYEEDKNIQRIAEGKIITTVYHTADIHIRTLDRHDEYKHVFYNLYRKLKEEPDLENSVLVICGDLFHNRDKLISESIILFNDLIEQLTSIIDVICILGNHDTFTHQDRLDTVTGIVDIKQFQNFHFLKYSGVYKYHNVDFTVSSLLDNVFIRERCVGSENIQIALYHGPITGSKIDEHYEIPKSQDHFTVKDFKNFDYTLLGDIHKKQFLTKNIAYPGSLIQQNFKEDRVHGILKWDLENYGHSFLEVKNDYGFITLKYKDNEVVDKDVVYPKYSRIKVYHNYNENFDIYKVKDYLSTKTEVISLVKEVLPPKDFVFKATQIQTESREEIDSKYFTDYISTQTEATQEQITSIHLSHLNKILNSKNSDGKNASLCSWEITKLEFKNIFIYGKDYHNVIDFEGITGVIGILQNNAAGKSSILNAILYALFGNSYKSKNISNRNIINKFAKEFFIKLTIKTDSCYYIIYREGKNKTRKNGVKGMEETVTIQRVSNEEITNLTDTTKSTTVEKIHEILGLTNKEDFLLTNVLSYSNYVSLLNMTSSEISSVFSTLFNVSHYKEIYNQNLKDIKKLTGEINTQERILENYTRSKKNIQDLENEIETIKSEIVDQNEIKERLENDLDSLKYSLDGLSSKVIIEPFECEFTEEELEDKLWEIGCPEEDETIGILTKKLALLKDVRKPTLFVETGDDVTESSLEQEILDLELKKLKVIPPKIKSEKEYKKLLDKEKFSIQAIIDDLKVVKVVDGVVNIDEDLYVDILEFLNDANDVSFLDDKMKILEYQNYLETSKINNEINLEIANKKMMLQNIRYLKKIDIEKKIEYLKLDEMLTKLRNYNKFKDALIETKKLQTQIQLVKKKRSETECIISKLNMKVGNLLSEIKQQQDILEHEEEVKETILSLKQDKELLDIYKGIVGDKCLPKMIISDTIKKVEIEANLMIYKLAGLYINFNSVDIEDKWEITVKKNDIYLGVEHLSGYERFIVNTGLKLSLDKYKFYPGTRIFFIDEVFDCISEENFDRVEEVFDYLKTYYKNVLVVSHNENLKKKIDRRILISTDYVNSKIKGIV